MGIKQTLQSFIRKQLLNPKAGDEHLEAHWRQIKDHMPIPVFWLLGKAQSGKTAIIHALTGDSRATIGDGIRPCTRTALLYDFPHADHCLLRFLDTRGLGEVEYDPGEDITVFAQQAHLLIVVVKAMDHAQQAVLQVVREIRKKRPDWPLIVVQTTLHEGYPEPGQQQVEPYPYRQDPLPAAVPVDLARSLQKQRESFQDFNPLFVAVDFTLPEDGYAVVHYGIEALWETIEEALPLGLAAMISASKEWRDQLRDTYGRAAHSHILAYAVAAGGAGAIPIPFVDVSLVTLIQAKMLQAIASIYEQRMDAQRLGEIAGALGVGLLTNLGRRELIKFVPFYGAVVSSVLTAAATYALGKTLCAYFVQIRGGGTPNPERLRALYAEQFREGRQLLKRYVEKLGRSA
jgi:uncharacterized protein (DUF697 family)